MPNNVLLFIVILFYRIQISLKLLPEFLAFGFWLGRWYSELMVYL
jgi:hypothetical protein